jgi:hypothetical protein
MRNFARDKDWWLIFRRQTMQAGTAAVFDGASTTVMPQRETQNMHVGKFMPVAQQRDHRVTLVELLPGAPVDFEPRCAADIVCLDIEKFGVEGAVGWVVEVQDRRIDADKLPLCIVVLGNEQRLSLEELWHVFEELDSAGAIFHSWPENCRSFEEAFRLLGESIARSYERSAVLEIALA